MPNLDKTNASTRRTAEKRGHKSYPKLVVDSWPACVDCDGLLVNWRGPGLRRKCLCPGVEWKLGPEDLPISYSWVPVE